LFYVDVLGFLVQINEPEWVHFANQATPALRRDIVIRDDKYSTTAFHISQSFWIYF